MSVSHYFDTRRIEDAVRRGEHRSVIGGMWDEIGDLQFVCLRNHGLLPRHTLLDIGCGSLRGGIRFVDYLDRGNYFGIDVNQSLLDAGFEVELAMLGLQEKLPRENLLCDADFSFERFDRAFDFALALSVFTHLPLNHIRVCLERLRPCMAENGVLFASYFEIPASRATYKPAAHEPGQVTTHGAQDPYHYRFADFSWLAGSLGWSVEELAGFDHPRAQKMLRFTT